MARPSGLPKTGGRKKGSGNKVKAEQVAAVVASGLTPLQYMLQEMRDERNVKDVRMEAAKAAAPYVHAKLSAMEVTGKEGKDLIPEPADPTDIARRLAFVLTAATKLKKD